MHIHADNLQICSDCLLFVANGDLPDDRPNLPELIAMEWGDNAAHIVCGDSEKDSEFSWSSCDTCGSSLGGSRHDAAILCSHPECANNVLPDEPEWATPGTGQACGAANDCHLVKGHEGLHKSRLGREWE